MIRFRCPACYQAHELPDSLAGTQGSCPSCGQRLQFPFPVPVQVVEKPKPTAKPESAAEQVVRRREDRSLGETSLQVNLGAVQSLCGKLSFSFVVRDNGDAYLQIFGSDPSDGRKAGVLVTLDGAEYEKLKALIEKTDQTIEKLRAAGQIRRMQASSQ
jgi:hypothetical protein